jgi:fatty-acyl-CoA synthase
MGVRVSESTASAYHYPLLLKHLLHMPLATARDQEIIYRDRRRYTYATLDTRIRRLANLLARLGVEAGTTVAVMDWDSHRYLESYFAIPMLGAILQTVNIRLATGQIGYTLRDSAAAVLLINRDFLPILRSVQRQPTLRTLVLLDDEAEPTVSNSPSGDDERAGYDCAGEYEALLAGESGRYEFADFNENAIATTFHTTGTTGTPKAVSFSHRQLVLHTLAGLGALASAPDAQSLRFGDVYMPTVLSCGR